jgi:hypothetical protein
VAPRIMAYRDRFEHHLMIKVEAQQTAELEGLLTVKCHQPLIGVVAEIITVRDGAAANAEAHQKRIARRRAGGPADPLLQSGSGRFFPV